MGGKVWAIKSGSGGAYVDFCERHGPPIVGVGWQTVDPVIVKTGRKEELWDENKAKCGQWYGNNNRKIGKATGQLFRFGQECKKDDYVLYYNPQGKHVRVCRVVSGPLFRNFQLDDKIDIWHYREVEHPIDPIPVLDLHGSLKGRLLSPRMSFWNMGPVFQTVDQIARGQSPHLVLAPDPQLKAAYDQLQSLVRQRAQDLNAEDWELLVADYAKGQGATLEGTVGGHRRIIDVEAVFDHGELGRDGWRFQVKRYEGRQVDWPEIERDYRRAGDANFCFVSVFGFTNEAREKAEEEEIALMEASDFFHFLLSGKLRPELRDKLQLPFWTW